MEFDGDTAFGGGFGNRGGGGGGGRGGGFAGRGRGRGGRGGGGGVGGQQSRQGGGGVGGRGAMHRVQSSGEMPPPPNTPLSDPYKLPFPRLMGKSQYHSMMTKDEELLRAIIGLFTVGGHQSLAFEDISQRLRTKEPELFECIYSSDAHLWSYLRCYPEQFGIDRDPRQPWHVEYLTKSKIVAKADRARYQREYNAGTIRPEPDPNVALDAVKYDVEMERKAATYILGIIVQSHKVRRDAMVQIDVKHLATVFRPSYGIPREVCDYVGELDSFLHKRYYLFCVFGAVVDLASRPLTDVIRKLTINLKQYADPQGYVGLKDFYEYFRREFKREDFQALQYSEVFTYHDFLMTLHQYPLLFHLHARDDRVQLRHDIVPEISWEEVNALPEISHLRQVMKDLEAINAAYATAAMESSGGHTRNARVAGQDMDTSEENIGDDDDIDYESDTDDGYIPAQVPRQNRQGASAGAGNSMPAEPTLAQNITPAMRALANMRMFQGHQDQIMGSQGVQGQSSNYGTAQAIASAAPSNMTRMAANYSGDSSIDSIGYPPPQVPPPAATRIARRGGARPPRASNRCRPPIADRLTVMTPVGGRADLEDELPDYE